MIFLKKEGIRRFSKCLRLYLLQTAIDKAGGRAWGWIAEQIHIVKDLQRVCSKILMLFLL